MMQFCEVRLMLYIFKSGKFSGSSDATKFEHGASNVKVKFSRKDSNVVFKGPVLTSSLCAKDE